MKTDGTAVKPSEMAPLSTFETTYPTKINWKSYTVKKLNNVATFFTNRARNFFYGCGLGLKRVCHVTLVASVIQLARGKALENIISNSNHDYPPFFAAYVGALEEIFFRGIVQNCIYGISTLVFNKINKLNFLDVETKAYYTAVIPTSILSGLFHWSNPKSSFIETTYAISCGFQYGYVSHYDGLDKAMWAHATFNYIEAWVNLIFRAYTTQE